MCVLTEEEAAKLRLKLARERARYLEGADREARSRALALKSAKKEKKAKRKQQAQREAALTAARAAGKKPKPLRRSVHAIPGGAFESNRRKF
jgi:hypothetical protein